VEVKKTEIKQQMRSWELLWGSITDVEIDAIPTANAVET
jgi:hypothetical protein